MRTTRLLKRFSLKQHFFTLFLLSTAIPFFIILWLMPSYYNEKNQEEIVTLTESTMSALANTFSLYLEDLNRYTLSPYINDGTMNALRLKASGEYTNLSPHEQLLTNRAFKSIVEHFATDTRDKVLSMVLIAMDGSVVASSKYDGHLKEAYDFNSKPWYVRTLSANGKSVFIGRHAYDYFTRPTSSTAFSIARSIKDPNTRETLGVLIASADTQLFHTLTKDLNLGVSSAITIVNERNDVIYTTKSLSPDIIYQLKMNSLSLYGNNDSYIQIVHPIDKSPWKLKTLISRNDLKSKTNWIYAVASLIGILVLILISTAFINFSFLIVRPFTQMKKIMGHVENGDLSARFLPKHSNEVTNFGLALNGMIEKLEYLIEKEYKTALALKTAEYNALSSQIQPHFLFNTLNGFIGLNRLGQTDLLEKSILALTNMLRYSLNTETIVLLEKEFQFLENYLALQQLRFSDRFEVDFFYEEELGKLPLPKLLLQPFIENSIIHGIEPSDSFCKLTIHASKMYLNNTPVILLLLADTGVGFDLENQEEHIGMHHSKERLRFIYPDAIFRMESKIGVGTTIKIYIPWKEDYLQ